MARGRDELRVAVIFTAGQPLRPVWFEHNRRRHTVVETTYRWRDQVGEAPLLHFTVTDGEALFELVYNLKEASWGLQRQQAVS